MNVQVTIRGRQFNFRTDDDGAKLKKMADDLNERLNSQAGRSKTVDEYSIAVITALSLMGEIELLKKQHESKLDELHKDIVSLTLRLEALLPPSDEA